ncbi:MAG: N-acetylmuramoyl-L-alanine amidase [Candidatus Dormibacteria bacterium]
MRLRARLLHVLAIAPVAASAAAVLGVSTHARAASTPAPPKPIVIALDAGHGGVADPNDPAQPFDPGAISASGLQEQEVTLDVAQRVAALLREDLVEPVMTRTGDEWVSISDREQIAVEAHAQLFVSVHVNSYQNASASGSLVLYPGAWSQAFAQTLEDALGRDLASAGVSDDGIVLRDNWWIHNPMPTGTVEMAYMSNPREAGLMATEDFRQAVALAVRDGVERYDPQIAQRKAEILAWQQAHPGAPTATPVPVTRPSHATAAPAPRTSAGSPLGTIAMWTLFIGAILACWYWRRPILNSVEDLGQVFAGTSLHRAAARRRRRQLRLNSLGAAPQRRWALHSVYDDLPL